MFWSWNRDPRLLNMRWGGAPWFMCVDTIPPTIILLEYNALPSILGHALGVLIDRNWQPSTFHASLRAHFGDNLCYYLNRCVALLYSLYLNIFTWANSSCILVVIFRGFQCQSEALFLRPISFLVHHEFCAFGSRRRGPSTAWNSASLLGHDWWLFCGVLPPSYLQNRHGTHTRSLQPLY